MASHPAIDQYSDYVYADAGKEFCISVELFANVRCSQLVDRFATQSILYCPYPREAVKNHLAEFNRFLRGVGGTLSNFDSVP